MPAGVVAFWSLSLVLAVSPGADWATRSRPVCGTER